MADQKLAALFKWSICSKFKAIEEIKTVEIEPCICDSCTTSRRNHGEGGKV